MKKIYFILLASVISFNCQRELTAVPSVITATTISVTNTTALSGGNITDDGGLVITARGVCWSINENPAVNDNHTTDGSGIGIFASSITGLTANTTYHVRAYAINANSTAYGGDSSFTTNTSTSSLLMVTTSSITDINATTATGGGNVIADGGSPVIVRGICWSKTANPVVTDIHTNDGSGIGIFASSITGLTANTTYHVRAYAINAVDTAYGGDSVFTTTIASAPIVYVAGCQSGDVNPWVAKLWKDGVVSNLAHGNSFYIRATSVFVSGTDVYVAGYEGLNGGATKSRLWKNGVVSTLTNSGISMDSRANSVFVSGSDVYAAGVDNLTNPPSPSQTAVIWKNGFTTNLSGDEATCVFALGADVYAGGHENNGGIANGACIWKNGAIQRFTTGVVQSAVNSIYISGTNVYAAGYENNGTKNVAKVWKNGVAIPLTDGSENAVANSIFISGTDVYVAGYEEDAGASAPKLWKNGVATILPVSAGSNATALSIFVFNTDVYVSGQQNNSGNYAAVVWKNGALTVLPDSYIGAGIFVK